MQTPAILRLNRSATRSVRWLRQLWAGPWTRLAFYCLLSLAACWSWLDRADQVNQFRDAQVLQTYERIAVRSVVEHFELPLWNPYYCGGMYALGTPQSRFATPFFAVSLVLGALRAQPVIAFLLLVLGMEGFFRYSRLRCGSAVGSAMAAPLFALSGFYAVAYFNGWLNFFGFLLIPWVLWGFYRALRGQLRGVVWTGIWLATIIGFGGTYAGPIGVLLMGIEVARFFVERPLNTSSARCVVTYLALTFGVVTALCAFRLWPVFETLYASPRIMAGTPSLSLGSLSGMMFTTAAPTASTAGRAGYFFLGVLPLVLALPGLRGKRAVVLLVGVVFSLWTATGYTTFGPFVWLRALPIYETFRNPERFLFVTGFFVVQLSAQGIDRLICASRKYIAGRWLVLAAVGLVLSTYGLQLVNYHRTGRAMTMAAPPRAVAGPFKQARGNRWVLIQFEPMERGSLSCFEAYPVVMSAELRGDLPREAYLVPSDGGQVTPVHWSPNRLEFRVTAHAPVSLIINQNWHQGWGSTSGRPISYLGLLAVELPEGNHHVSLRFRPKSALGGVLISLTALAVLGFLVATRRRIGGSGLLSVGNILVSSIVASAIAGGIAAIAIDEAPVPPPILRNANRAPALVDQLPDGVRSRAVTLNNSIQLIGARAEVNRENNDIVDVELYLRIKRTVPRSTVLLVELIGPAGQIVRSDHQVLAASLFFDEVPATRIVRDAFSVYLNGDRRGEWQLRVGLADGVKGGGRRVFSAGATGAPPTNVTELLTFDVGTGQRK